MSLETHPVEKEELMAYLDGEVSAERARALAAHLESCEECKAVAADFGQISERLAAWQVEPPSARLTEQVAAALKAHFQEAAAPGRGPSTTRIEPPKRHLRNWILGFAGGAVLFVLAVAVSIPNLLRSRMAANRAGEWKSPAASGVAPYAPAVAGVSGPESGMPIAGPMIVRTASLTLVAKDFESARAEIEQVIRRHQGYSAQLTVTGYAGGARTLDATFRIPARELDATLAELKKLGHVTQESQSGEEVTSQYVDLEARLSNARATEQRLVEILRQRTGKVADVLAVEREIARVREEIERLDAERKNLENQVALATLKVVLSEEYQVPLEAAPASAWTRLRNSAVEGYRDLTENALGLVLFLLSYGPTLLFWGFLLFWPARFGWRRLRKRAQ